MLNRSRILLEMPSRIPKASLGETSGEGPAPLVCGDDQDLGFRSTPLEPDKSIGFKLPARIFFPLAALIGPVRILRQNQLQLLCSTPAFEFDFPHPCADGAPKRFTPDKHVELVSRGEAIRIEFVFVLIYAIRQRAGEPDIQLSRFVRHDVSPVGLHACATDCTRLEISGADSSGLTEAMSSFYAVLMFGSRNGMSLSRRCGLARAVWQRDTMRRGKLVLRLARRTILLEPLSPSTCYPEFPTASLGEIYADKR